MHCSVLYDDDDDDDDDVDDDDNDVKHAAARRLPCSTPSASRRVRERVPTCTASRRHRATVTSATRAANVHRARSSLPSAKSTSPTIH